MRVQMTQIMKDPHELYGNFLEIRYSGAAYVTPLLE